MSPESPPHTGDLAGTPTLIRSMRHESDPVSAYPGYAPSPTPLDRGFDTATYTNNSSAVGFGLGVASSVGASSTVGTIIGVDGSDLQKASVSISIVLLGFF